MSEQGALCSRVEVERKFIPTALLQAQLDGKYGDYERLRRQQSAGNVAQQSSGLSFFRLPDKEIRDRYIDYHGQLLKRNAYVRKRTSKVIRTYDFPLVNDGKETPAEWQARMRLGGVLTSAQMLEASGVPNMRQVAKLFTPGVEIEQYRYTAVFVTRRKTYVVQKPFGWHSEANQAGEIRVMLDETVEGGEAAVQGDDAFRHVVGEVELTAEVAGGEAEDEHDALRRQKVLEMQARLDEFIRRNAAVFPRDGVHGAVKGKLEAFFEWKAAREGRGALV